MKKNDNKTDFFDIIMSRVNNLKIKSKIKNCLFESEDRDNITLEQ